MRPQRFAKYSLQLAASCLLALTLIPAGVAALPQDDLALFSMRGVIIKMKDDREIAGYVVYDPSLSDDVKFPKVLLDPNLRPPICTSTRKFIPFTRRGASPKNDSSPRKARR